MNSIAVSLSALDAIIADAEGYAENLLSKEGLLDSLEMVPVLNVDSVRFVSVITPGDSRMILKKVAEDENHSGDIYTDSRGKSYVVDPANVEVGSPVDLYTVGIYWDSNE
ncbi:MAG: hypothetical protein KDD56_06725 [Bdellovibrionales bacterium]|nr:hypothetical protein [Bdellovibrionales bacterium]